MSQPLLELDAIVKRFGAVTAVDGVSFRITSDGGITALIGPNGAGKTTLYNTISGTLKPTEGSIRLHGDDITDDSPADRTERGIGRSFQITNIFDSLSVYRNVRIPVIARLEKHRNPFSKVDDDDVVAEETEEILELVGIDDIADEESSALPYGDKRRVEIAITLATDPDLILLDEPTAGMTREETSEMVTLIEELNQKTDTTFMMTEHNIDVIFSVADRILVLDRGSIIADGTPEAIRSNQRVQEAYLGGTE